MITVVCLNKHFNLNKASRLYNLPGCDKILVVGNAQFYLSIVTNLAQLKCMLI